MKHIQISDDAYDAIASRHGDVAAFVEQIARQQAEAPVANGDAEPPQRSFYDALAEQGLVGCIKDAPADLSTNPKYMDDFGR